MKINEIVVGTPVILWSPPILPGIKDPDQFGTKILSEPWELSLGKVVCRVEGYSSPVDIQKLTRRFDLIVQWEVFLKEMNLDEEKMPLDQRTQIKQAFYAGCGQMLMLVRDDVGDLKSEKDMIAAMEDLMKQVNDFWDAQSE